MTENKDTAIALFEELRGVDLKSFSLEKQEEIGKKLLLVLPPRAQVSLPINAYIYATYCLTNDFNIMRGPYAWEQGKQKKLQISDPYTLQIRWAKLECDYDEWTEVKDPKDHGLTEDDIVVQAWVLRSDKLAKLERYVKIFGEDKALQMVASTAIGVVEASDQYYNSDWVNGRKVMRPRDKWHAIDPPHGWTWEQVAAKRAIKNALRFSHGEPTQAELRKLAHEESWEVEGTVTELEDWVSVSADQPPAIQAQEAKLSAEARQIQERVDERTPEENMALIDEMKKVLHGDEDPDVDLVQAREEAKKKQAKKTEPEPEPEAEPEPEGEPEPEPVEIDPKLLDELSTVLADLEAGEQGAGTFVVDGKHRYLVGQLYEVLGLGMPDWKTGVTVANVRELLITSGHAVAPDA